jgi:hypothetical protein
MNLYVIVEGEGTEIKLYPAWFDLLVPKLKRIDHYKKANHNNYYLFCGGGIPQIYKHTSNAIQDINQIGQYDYLVVCVDSEDLLPGGRTQKLSTYLSEERVKLNPACVLIVIEQHSCVETWFLGNRKIFKRNPSGELFQTYSEFYSVFENDPELMPNFGTFKKKAHFHEAYLREMLKEHDIAYRKSAPNEVLKPYYLEELKRRINETPDHLISLQFFFTFCESLRVKSDEVDNTPK